MSIYYMRLCFSPLTDKKRLDLAKKIEDATASASCPSVNISTLILNRPYPIVSDKRI